MLMCIVDIDGEESNTLLICFGVDGGMNFCRLFKYVKSGSNQGEKSE